MSEASGATLLCVAPDKIESMWPHVAAFIEAAYLTGLGDDTVASVKAALDAGTALLWIVWDGESLLAAAVTEICRMPARKVCVIKCCAGHEMHRWIEFISNLEDYAKHEGCSLIRLHGRPGWKAMLPHYREPWRALEKEL